MGGSAEPPFTIPSYRTGPYMKDIRDPQVIGEVLLRRDPQTSVIEAANDLPGYFIPKYGETKEEQEQRLAEITAITNGKTVL